MEKEMSELYGTLNFDVADVTKRPRRSLRRS